MNAIVVEQQGENREVVTSVLERLGYATLPVDWPYRAIDYIRVQSFDLCVINVDRRLDLRRFLRILRESAPPILFLSEKSSRQHYNEVLLELEGDHLVSKMVLDPAAEPQVTPELLTHSIVRLQKTEDMGLTSILPYAEIQEYPILGSADKDDLFETLETFAEGFSIRNRVIQNILHLCDELVMNVIFNAPQTHDGGYHYRDMPRDSDITLEDRERGSLSYGFDGQFFGLSAVDPFGALTLETVKKYITRSYQDYHIPKSQAGGGMGFLNMLAFSSFLEVFILKGKMTRVSVLLNVKQGLKEARSTPRSLSLREVSEVES